MPRPVRSSGAPGEAPVLLRMVDFGMPLQEHLVVALRQAMQGAFPMGAAPVLDPDLQFAGERVAERAAMLRFDRRANLKAYVLASRRLQPLTRALLGRQPCLCS